MWIVLTEVKPDIRSKQKPDKKREVLYLDFVVCRFVPSFLIDFMSHAKALLFRILHVSRDERSKSTIHVRQRSL